MYKKNLVKFVLETPVSVNAKVRFGKSGYYCNPRYKEWFDRALKRLVDNKFKSFGNKRLGMSVRACFKDSRKRDLDNILKGLFDVCTKSGLYDDDSQIDSLTVERGETVKYDCYALWDGTEVIVLSSTMPFSLKEFVKAKKAIKTRSFGIVEVCIWELESDEDH